VCFDHLTPFNFITLQLISTSRQSQLSRQWIRSSLISHSWTAAEKCVFIHASRFKITTIIYRSPIQTTITIIFISLHFSLLMLTNDALKHFFIVSLFFFIIDWCLIVEFQSISNDSRTILEYLSAESIFSRHFFASTSDHHHDQQRSMILISIKYEEI
jgi:hypothetical protein